MGRAIEEMKSPCSREGFTGWLLVGKSEGFGNLMAFKLSKEDRHRNVCVRRIIPASKDVHVLGVCSNSKISNPI